MRKLGITLGVLAALYFGGAMALVLWPGPGHSDSALETKRALEAGEITREEIEGYLVAAGMLSREQVNAFEERRFQTRDGRSVFAREFAGAENSGATIILVHGVGSDSSPFNVTAAGLRDATGATVLAIDLRGHGKSEGARWDVDYIGQHEDDLADIVRELKRTKQDTKIVLSGHSMGGGISLRFAALADEPSIDGYLLFAPNLGATAPTARTAPPEDAAAADQTNPYMSLRLPRLIGLVMLNSVGIEMLNHLQVMFLNVPPDFPAYSYRGLVSGEPTNYVAAFEAVDKPLLVIVGTQDEAFLGEQFEPIVSQYSDGEVLLLEGATHNSVHRDERALEAIQEWYTTL